MARLSLNFHITPIRHIKTFFSSIVSKFKKKKKKPQTKHLTIIRGNKFLVHVMKVCLHLKKWTFNSSVNTILFNYNPLMIDKKRGQLKIRGEKKPK